jgi:hypothetical protein
VNFPKRNLRARETQAGTFMSLSDPLFDGMFHGDGRARVTGTCFCGADTSDADEAQCRRCLQDEPSVYGPDSPSPPTPPTSGEVKDMGVRLVAAAAAAVPPGWSSRASTPTARAVPLQTAAGTPSSHIPLVIVSPTPMTEMQPLMQPLVACSSGKKGLTEEQAARKKATDRQSQKRRVGRMQALKSENEAHEKRIKVLQQTVRGLQASLQRQVGGRSNANSTTRGGLHEHLLITHYPNWQSVKFALDGAYCKDDGSQALAVRSCFQDETGDVKVEGRYLWNPIGQEPFGGLQQLQEYAQHLLEAGNGRLLFRCEGAFGKGMQILDSGDCHSKEPLGECHRSFLHRDWDNNRLNSLTIILALGNDVMGYVGLNAKGEEEDRIVTMKPGEMHIFPTSVYHFGCSHADYNNTIEGMQGQTKSSLRRRVFCYMDWDSTVKDEEGFVDSAKMCPVPADYNLKIVRDIPNASVALTYLASPTLEGRTMLFENNKLVGNVLASSPLANKRPRTKPKS